MEVKQKTNIISGIITKIEPINRGLSLVTLETPGESFVSATLPFYSKLDNKYLGRNIDFQTTTTGRFLKTIEQKIVGSNFSVSVTLSKPQINQINQSYVKV